MGSLTPEVTTDANVMTTSGLCLTKQHRQSSTTTGWWLAGHPTLVLTGKFCRGDKEREDPAVNFPQAASNQKGLKVQKRKENRDSHISKDKWINMSFLVTQRGPWGSQLDWNKNGFSLIWPIKTSLVLCIAFFCLFFAPCTPLDSNCWISLHANYMLLHLPERLPCHSVFFRLWIFPVYQELV